LVGLAVHEPSGCIVEDAYMTPASARTKAMRFASRPVLKELSQVESSVTVRTAPSRFRRTNAMPSLQDAPLLKDSSPAFFSWSSSRSLTTSSNLRCSPSNFTSRSP